MDIIWKACSTAHAYTGLHPILVLGDHIIIAMSFQINHSKDI